MAEAVYILCALTSIACSAFLGRAYSRTRSRLLLWSLLCFVMLAINNVLLYLDLSVLGNSADLSVIRNVTSLVAAALMVFGLVWDSDWVYYSEGKLMGIPPLSLFISGASCALYFVAALLFLRCYRKAKDRLFICFAAAFAVLGVSRGLFFIFKVDDESNTTLYAVRLIAFGLILYAIIDKNMRPHVPARREQNGPRERGDAEK